MSANSKIEWTDHTFNPWIGCTKVSPACDHCYAEVSTPSRTLGVTWGAGQPRRRTSDANWALPERWNAQAEAFHAQHGRRQRVFCASLADVFDNQAPQAWRDDLWALIEATPHLTWMLLTKRPQKIVGMVPPAWLIHPPANVWYGSTIENRATLAQRAHHLAEVPAALRFWSCEPLLEDLGDVTPLLTGLGLIIAGGESGPKARPSHPVWWRSLRNQCVKAGKPFHFKQWGEWAPGHGPLAMAGDPPGSWRKIESVKVGRKTYRGANIHQFGDGTVVIRLGKKTAGRQLDVVTHDEMPA